MSISFTGFVPCPAILLDERSSRHRTDFETIIVRDLIRINQPIIGKEEIDAATEVLKSGILTEKSGMGPRPRI